MDYGKLINGPDVAYVMKMAFSGFADMTKVDISGSEVEEIDLSVLIGTKKLFRGLKSTDSSDGDVLIKTKGNYSYGYVPYPLKSGEKDIVLLPFTHIKKTGSISGVIVYWQDTE
ncbi:MAG: hypothetical protein LLG05_03435 [Porphyromonadaceae bacterium]|nr:hypothetical protein [Porphyromonadaceae bacterium]